MQLITGAGVVSQEMLDALNANFAELQGSRAGATSGRAPLYVDTVSGSPNNDGSSQDKPLSTMAAAFGQVQSNDVIYVRGRIREQLIAPIGKTGVKIIGLVGGSTRHDDGVRWDSPASPAANTPLLTLRNQGWELHGILFVPATGIAAVRLRREETATFPDASHALIRGCKFVSDAGTAIEDYGGCHHVAIVGNEFAGSATTLPKGIDNVNTSIANPLRWAIVGNTFFEVDEQIDLPATQCLIRGNVMCAGTIVIDTGGGAGKNRVIGNEFADDEADVSNGNGYTGHADDIWRNHAADQPDATAGVPGA